MMGDKNKKENGNGKASETAKDWMACKGQFNRVADIVGNKGETMERIKIGDRIRIKRMDGEPSYNGKDGVVVHVDGIGQLHGTWGGLAVQPWHDDVELA